ncbi:hypothetical protein M3Y99_01110300 [Aphelenchoides fujianensis]|nr:hypothetical protein M3Y99_01110300 [Aphelenchoides fujianensis]
MHGPRLKILLFIIGISLLILWACWGGDEWTGEPEVQLTAEECLCYGENFCFEGLDSNGRVVRSRRFDCGLYAGLKKQRLLDSDARSVRLADSLNQSAADWSPVFVTYASSDHLGESRVLIKSIRAHYPTALILYYDIGLTERDAEEVRSWCRVELRRFNFSAFPRHFSNLQTYAFKLLILQDVLNDAKITNFFVLDASIQVKNNDLYAFVEGGRDGKILPFTNLGPAGHSVYATTQPGKRMFRWLPLPHVVTQIAELESTLFVADAPYTRYVFKWFYLCAMTADCISPPGAQIYCKEDGGRLHFRKCHRFDQAFWNIAALARLFGPQREAVRLNWTTDWSQLNSEVVLRVEQRRSEVLEDYRRLIPAEHDPGTDVPLRIDCPQ